MARQNDPRTFEVQFHGRTYLVPISCPHRGGVLRLGTIDAQQGTLTCPLHQATFDLLTGTRLFGPPCGNLRIQEKRLS
jgi:nitrite reductase/ring-hydroxylating ferredoxin subunit